MNKPLISIIINSHNEGYRLKATIDSYRENVGSWPHEFIVVADGTTDGSADNLGDDVQVIKTDGCVGCGRAKHMAIEQAKGEILHFNDAHQVITPINITVTAYSACR